ncbi:MAG: beta-ketoacyl synthase N-terminal-like domain-containing protein [Pseudomonadota bacterium]
MNQQRVFVSGIGMISSLGNKLEEAFGRLIEGQSGVQAMPDWEKYNGLHSHLMAPAHAYDIAHVHRKKRRTMSPMSEMATIASRDALVQAGFDNGNLWEGLDPQRSLIIMGSTTGSPKTLEDHFEKLFERGGPEGQTSTAFFKIMNHSVASNVALALDYKGALLSTGSACSTSSQAMIQAWEMIQSGLYDFALVGGADEAFYTSAAIFDTVQAASTNYNKAPDQSPRPFDNARDGLVISEGAGIMILESESHLEKRGGRPIAEFLGGAYFCDGEHMSHPLQSSMAKTMRWALERTNLSPESVDYVNAHATSTVIGDRQEAKAIAEVFGNQTPVSSLKGHFGHSLAACGAIEAACCIEMMNSGLLIPNRNLTNVDPECTGINAIIKNTEGSFQTIMSNNFAFGGMNTSFLLKRCQ